MKHRSSIAIAIISFSIGVCFALIFARDHRIRVTVNAQPALSIMVNDLVAAPDGTAVETVNTRAPDGRWYPVMVRVTADRP